MIWFTFVKGHPGYCIEEWAPEGQAKEGDKETTAMPSKDDDAWDCGGGRGNGGKWLY